MPTPCRPYRCVWLFLLAGACMTGCEDSSEVVMVNSEKEANRILVELEQRGVATPAKTQQTANRNTVWVISVPHAQASQARQILVELDLPKESRGGLETMISDAGLIPTKTDERAKLMHAIAQELETTFETYDSVVRARVHVVIPDGNISLTADPEKQPKPSATVLIKHRVSATVADGDPTNVDQKPPMTEEDVQQIVAASVEGLNSTDVFVTFTPTEVTATADASSTTAAEGGGPQNKSLLYQLYAAVVALGALSVFLIVKLVKKPSPTRATPAPAA